MADHSSRFFPGEPPFPYNTEWFLAQVEGPFSGYVTLRSHPDDRAVYVTPANTVHFKGVKITAWAQLPDSTYMDFTPEPVATPPKPVPTPPTPEPQPAFDEPAGEARKSAESATKTRWDLVPSAAVAEIAEVLAFGAKKYGANNWCRGAAWHRYFRALIEHCFRWWRGEDKDPETGRSHLAHAGCCLFFLMEYQRNGWGTDDRFRGPDGEAFIKHDGIAEERNG